LPRRIQNIGCNWRDLDAARSTPHSALLHVARALECGLAPTRVRDDALLAPLRALGAPFDDLMALYDAAAPLCGYVEKQADAGPLRRRWRKRWAVRRGDRLLFFESHLDCASPMASIDLAAVHQLARSAREPLRFDLDSHRLRTATRGETDRWCAALSDTLSLLASCASNAAAHKRRSSRLVLKARRRCRIVVSTSERAAELLASDQAVITVDVALLRDLCDEVASLQAQVAALQSQLQASRAAERRLMARARAAARSQGHDRRDFACATTSRSPPSRRRSASAIGARCTPWR
jgi:hypothetical protein